MKRAASVFYIQKGGMSHGIYFSIKAERRCSIYTSGK